MQVDTEELHRLRETLGDLSGRVERLEQERDFYKDLLEPLPERPRLSASDSDGSENHKALSAGRMQVMTRYTS